MVNFDSLMGKAYINKEGDIEFWNRYKAEYSIDQYLDFTTRDEYLTWRAAWRAAYASLSSDIRSARKAWRAEGQSHDLALNMRLINMRRMARVMLAIRAMSKAKSAALYLAEREAVTA